MNVAVLIPAECQQCPGELEWLSGGAHTYQEACCMVRCKACGAEYLIRVHMLLKCTAPPEHWRRNRSTGGVDGCRIQQLPGLHAP